MSVFVEMEYISFKHSGNVKYSGYVANAYEFGFLLQRRGIHPDDIVNLSLNKIKRDNAAAIAYKALDAFASLEEKEAAGGI